MPTPLETFGHAVGMALTERKIPDDMDPNHMTPSQVIECTAGLLDRLDNASDAYLAAKGSDIKVGRSLQRDLLALLDEHDLRGYPVTLYREPEDGSWSVMAPDLPGHVGAAMTITDALREAADAMTAWIETAKANGMPVPPPSDPHA